MKHEFLTHYGKVILEREVLYFSSPYVPFGKTALAQIGFDVFFIVVFIGQFFIREDEPKKYVGYLLWIFIVLFRWTEMYDHLFKKSYATRLSLRKIKSAKVEDEDPYGILILVTLHLHNGRYKKILFRKQENQHEGFLAAISVPSCQSQLA